MVELSRNSASHILWVWQNIVHKTFLWSITQIWPKPSESTPIDSIISKFVYQNVWSTVSKALAKSRSATTFRRPLSIFVSYSFDASSIAVKVEWTALRPDWLLTKRLLSQTNNKAVCRLNFQTFSNNRQKDWNRSLIIKHIFIDTFMQRKYFGCFTLRRILIILRNYSYIHEN